MAASYQVLLIVGSTLQRYVDFPLFSQTVTRGSPLEPELGRESHCWLVGLDLEQ